MKNIISGLLLSVAIVSSSFAAGHSQLKKDISKYFTRNKVNVKSIKIIAEGKAINFKNLHAVIGMIKGSSKPFLLLYNKNTIIAGSIINRNNGKTVFTDFINKNRAKIKKALSSVVKKQKRDKIKDNKKLISLFNNKYKDLVLTIKGGNPNGKTVYLITDPNCPYCQEYEKNELPSTIKKSKEIKVIPIYLNIPGHETSPMRSSWLLEQGNKKGADVVSLMHKASDSSNKAYKKVNKKFAKKMISQMKVLISSGLIKGTPTMFDQNGNPTR